MWTISAETTEMTVAPTLGSGYFPFAPTAHREPSPVALHLIRALLSTFLPLLMAAIPTADPPTSFDKDPAEPRVGSSLDTVVEDDTLDSKEDKGHATSTNARSTTHDDRLRHHWYVNFSTLATNGNHTSHWMCC